MSRQDRAKQFAPFEALRGLRTALRKKEVEREAELEKRYSGDIDENQETE